VLAVDRDGDQVAGVGEQPAQRLADGVGVLDQQDVRAAARIGGPPARRGPGRCAFALSEKR